MKTLNLTQGSDEWLAHRRFARNASDVAVLLGCSPHKKYAELLYEKHTGITQSVDYFLQQRFDKGHVIEAAAISLAEKIVGDDLYSVVATNIVDGIELSASFDGLTLDETQSWECKTLNANLRTLLANTDYNKNPSDVLPLFYRAQMQQGLMVSGAKQCLFSAHDDETGEARGCWYYGDAELASKIAQAWRQFDLDLASYAIPQEAAAKALAAPLRALPAVVLQVSGSLSVQNNFSLFQSQLMDFVETSLIKSPQTDQDFADLSEQIKMLKKAESALDDAETHMLAQIEAVDDAVKTKDLLYKLVRQNRLASEKLLASEKEKRKLEIVQSAQQQLNEHLAGLQKTLGKYQLPFSKADFGAAIRGLSSLESMQDKLRVAVNDAKFAATAITNLMLANLAFYSAIDAVYKLLFADLVPLLMLSSEQFESTVNGRIAQHELALQRAAETKAKTEEGALAAKRLEQIAKQVDDPLDTKVLDAIANKVAELANAETLDAPLDSMRAVSQKYKFVQCHDFPKLVQWVLKNPKFFNLLLPNIPAFELLANSAGPEIIPDGCIFIDAEGDE